MEREGDQMSRQRLLEGTEGTASVLQVAMQILSPGQGQAWFGQQEAAGPGKSWAGE